MQTRSDCPSSYLTAAHAYHYVQARQKAVPCAYIEYWTLGTAMTVLLQAMLDMGWRGWNGEYPLGYLDNLTAK